MRISGYIPFPVRRSQGEGATGVPKGVVAVSAATGTSHLSRPRLYGPAERTVVEPWLTELSHLAINAYAETMAADSSENLPALALVECLPAPSPVAASHAPLAKAA
jgi:hypothetical protein